jgi:hypothetical protein
MEVTGRRRRERPTEHYRLIKGLLQVFNERKRKKNIAAPQKLV